MSSPNPVSSVPSLSQTSSSSNLQPSNPTPPVSIARGPNPARKRGRDEIDDDDVLSSDNDVLMTGVHAPVTSPEMSRSMDGAQATPPSSMPASPITAALQNMMATGQGEPAVVKNPTPGSATWAGNEDENAHKRTNRQSAPATDQITHELGVGWREMQHGSNQSPCVGATCRHILNFFPIKFESIQLIAKHDALDYNVIRTEQGVFLFTGNDNKGRLVADDTADAIARLKRRPIDFLGSSWTTTVIETTETHVEQQRSAGPNDPASPEDMSMDEK
ncbi:hypothetical protein MMC21_007325 [Puttea exsequens]|nr:hypothetical protein [Puttea exsequens]